MLAINEIYGPVKQGEGKSAGKQVMFIRTGGCNLACIWCDTPYTWNWIGTKFQHPDKFDPRKEIHKLTAQQIFDQLEQKSAETKAVVVSGGEPMLQQGHLISLFVILKQNNYWIEVETNGTIEPNLSFLHLVDQINCSPKLANSGPDNPLSKREVPEALRMLASVDKTTFKFVITSNEDLQEVLSLISKHKIRPGQVYLMPEGKTKDEQLAHQDQVRSLCEQFQFHFSPRLHVLEFGNKRGV